MLLPKIGTGLLHLRRDTICRILNRSRLRFAMTFFLLAVSHMNHNKKILVIAPPWVGDMVMTQALLRLLKKQTPNCSIDVFAVPMLHPLLKRMPEVDNCLVSPFQHGELKLSERFKIGKSLRKSGYTHAYLIPNSFKSALIPFFAKIPVRVGWRGEQRYFLVNDMRILCKEKLPLMVERFVALGYAKNEELAKPLLFPRLQVSEEQLNLALARLKITLLKKHILAICPGAEYGSAKRWPADYFAAIANAKRNEGWEVWIFGGPKDQAAAKEIQEQCYNTCVDLTGKTDIGEAVDLLSLATVVVANDSGLMHVAAALSKPLVAIYGPTSPKLAPPLSDNNFKILSLNLTCSPCAKRECPLGHHKCMKDLRAELVLRSIDQLHL